MILSDEEEFELVEVLDETYAMLTKVSTQSVTNDERKAARQRYKLPKLPATRTPCLDLFLKTEVPQVAKSLDSDLARVQNWYMDALAPLTTLAESEELSYEDVKKAMTTAVALIGNTNSRLLRLKREKLVGSFNKSLLPLVKEDKDFTGTAPNLFGTDFAKRSKEFTDQIKEMRSSLPNETRQNSEVLDCFFARASPQREATEEGAEAPTTTVGAECISNHNRNNEQFTHRHTVYQSIIVQKA